MLFAQQRLPQASELLLGGSIFPAMQNFLLAARAQGLGACLTSWASYGGEQLLREAVGVPEDWMLAGHVVVGLAPGQPRPGPTPPARRRRLRRPLGPTGVKVGVVGLGNMGGALAANLVAAGHAIVTHDAAGAGRSPSGATYMDTVPALAAAADRLVLSLPDGSASRGWRAPWPPRPGAG